MAGQRDELTALLRRLILPIFVPTVLYTAGTAAILPVVPLVGLRLGMSVPQVALIATLAGVVTVLGPIPTGRVMVRIGERAGLLVGGAIAIVAVLGCLVALRAVDTPGGAPGWAAPLYLGCILVLALGDLTWDLGRQTYLADRVPYALRARAMTLFGGTLRAGRVVGPLLGALAVTTFGVAGPFVVHLVLAAVCIGFVIAFVTPQAEGEARIGAAADVAPEATRRQILTPLLLVGAAVLILMASRANRDLVLPLLGAHFSHSAATVSLIFAITAAVELALILPAGIIMDRFGRAAVLVPCLVLSGVGYLLSPLAGSVLGFVALGCVFAVGNGLGAGINKTLSADLTPTRNRASWLGLWNSLTGAGTLLGPALVAAATAAASVVTAGVATGVLTLLGAGWAAHWVPRLVPGPRRRG